MKCRFCNSENIKMEIANDKGLDHHSYKLKENQKKYAICQKCFSIFRLDNNIPSFINEDYIKFERYGATASKDLLNKKNKTNKNEKENISSRDIEILNAIERHNINQDTKIVCDFGANKGELLSEIKSIFKTKKEIGIELDIFKNSDYGYEWFGKIRDAAKEHNIDLLIASHSLVLTDYSEFKEAINSNNIKHIIIVSQNPLNRPATLFYDDCISNPSIEGKAALLESLGYNIIESGFLPNHPYETIIVASKTIKKKLNIISQIDFKNYSVKEEKLKILQNYRDQAKIMTDNNINCIFGTGIDSSLLYYQSKKKVIFARDNAQFNELFLDSPVIDVNKIENQKIIVPRFLSNSEKIYQKLKNKNLNVYL